MSSDSVTITHLHKAFNSPHERQTYNPCALQFLNQSHDVTESEKKILELSRVGTFLASRGGYDSFSPNGLCGFFYVLHT